MTDDQQSLAGKALPKTVDGSQHARLELHKRFATGWRKTVGIGPEQTERLGTVLHQIGGATAFPVAEMQLAQVRLQLQRQPLLRGQLPREGGTALQRRADQHVPRAGKCHRIAHLLPAVSGQGVVKTAAKATALLGLAMAQQIDARNHALRSDTAASANVAISLCSAQACCNNGTASAAPLPSPRRKPRSSSGTAPSDSRTAR